MTDPRSGAGDLGPGENAPGPSSFPGRSRVGRRPIAFPGRKASKPVPPEGVDVPPDAGIAAQITPAADEPTGAEPPDELARAAAEVFGERLGLARDFARLLVTD